MSSNGKQYTGVLSCYIYWKGCGYILWKFANLCHKYFLLNMGYLFYTMLFRQDGWNIIHEFAEYWSTTDPYYCAEYNSEAYMYYTVTVSNIFGQM